MSKTWDITKTKGFISLSIADDKLEMQSTNHKDNKIIPLSLITKIISAENADNLSIFYKKIDTIKQTIISFKNNGERDNVFQVLAEAFEPKFQLNLKKPNKLLMILPYFVFFFFPCIILFCAFWARTNELGISNLPKDNVERIAQILAKLIFIISVAIGPRILFIICGLLATIIFGIIIYKIITIPNDLPLERVLMRREKQ